MPDIEIPDNGVLAVQIGDTLVPDVDAFHAYTNLQAIREKYGAAMTRADMLEFVAAVKEFLGTVGFGGVSYAAALKFHNTLTAAVGDLRGNGPAGPTPGSPGSTAPPPSDSPAG